MAFYGLLHGRYAKLGLGAHVVLEHTLVLVQTQA